MFRFIPHHAKPLVLAAVLFSSTNSMLYAEEPVQPAAPPPAAPQTDAPIVQPGQQFFERDPVSGVLQLMLLQPNGEKQLLQTFPNRERFLPGPMSSTEADYQQALSTLSAGERFIIGVELKPIPEGLHARLGIEKNCGLIVARLIPEKPAAVAGVQQYDMLLKINGKSVCQPGEVVRLVNEAKGQPITLTLVRDAGPFDVSVTPVLAGPEDIPARTSPPISLDAKFPPGVLPPGMQIVGPGMIIPASRNPELELLHSDIAALQAQVKTLCDQVQQLQKQLKDQ